MNVTVRTLGRWLFLLSVILFHVGADAAHVSENWASLLDQSRGAQMTASVRIEAKSKEQNADTTEVGQLRGAMISEIPSDLRYAQRERTTFFKI